MSCIVHIHGAVLDVDALLEHFDLEPFGVWRKGEARALPRLGVHGDSGLKLLASDADLDRFDHQVEETTASLEQHADTLAGAAAFPGVDESVFSFGIGIFGEFVARHDELPRSLIAAAARVNAAIWLSHYLCSDDED